MIWSCWMLYTQEFFLETLIRVYCWSGCRRPSSIRRSHSQVTSFAARVRAMDSASIKKRAIVGCLFEHQLTGPPLRMNTNLEVNFLLSLSPAQSESE